MGRKKRCPGLPEADLIRILLRLPVVSLLRFKSVSKSWCSLIQTSSFINRYFKSSSSSSNKFGSFIFQAALDCERFSENALLMLSSVVPESESVSVSFGPDGCVNDDDDQVGVSYDDDDDDDDQQQQLELELKLDNLGFPSCYNFGKVRVIGSCNGLICLHDSERGDVSLWNPVTRQFRILPKSITTFDGDSLDHHRLFAFGFDAKTKDYNVVLVSGLRLRPRIIDGLSAGPMECLCRVQVYSLRTDSWRLLEGINMLPGVPFRYPDSPGLLYLKGSCIFMAKFLYSEHCIPPSHKANDRFIISLDLTTEIITPIQLPHHYHCGSEEFYICCLDDKLALFKATNRYIGTDGWKIFELLVLKEHWSSSSRRNYDSWTELHFFQIKHGLPGEWIIPRGISKSKDGVFVFLETGIHGLDGLDKKKMKLYNLITREVKKNLIYSDQVLSDAYAYKPSLVSIIGGNGCSSRSYGIGDGMILETKSSLNWAAAAKVVVTDGPTTITGQCELVNCMFCPTTILPSIGPGDSQFSTEGMWDNSSWEDMLKWWSLSQLEGTSCTAHSVRATHQVYEIATFLFFPLCIPLVSKCSTPGEAEKVEELLDELQSYAESINLAFQLHLMGALEPLLRSMSCSYTGVRARAAKIVCSMVQNNPRSQLLVMEECGEVHLLDAITCAVDATTDTTVLDAISSLFGNNKHATAFRQRNGYADLDFALSTASVKYQRQALILIHRLVSEHKSDCNIVIGLGYHRYMMKLASSYFASVRVAALRCLFLLTEVEGGGNSDQLVKNDDKLKQVLEELIKEISAMAQEGLVAARREEIQLVDSLWNACYNKPSSVRGLLVTYEEAPALSPPFAATKSFPCWVTTNNL